MTLAACGRRIGTGGAVIDGGAGGGAVSAWTVAVAPGDPGPLTGGAGGAGGAGAGATVALPIEVISEPAGGAEAIGADATDVGGTAGADGASAFDLVPMSAVVRSPPEPEVGGGSAAAIRARAWAPSRRTIWSE